MKTKIISQEAYASYMVLNVDFIANGVEYNATCVYYNGNGLEDIEVNEIETGTTAPQKVFEYGRQLLEELDIEKYLTF